MSVRLLGAVAGVGVVLVACERDVSFTEPVAASASSAAATTVSTTGAGGGASSSQSSSTGTGGGCEEPGNDSDGDGYAVPDDCDDCDALVNPSAVEVPDDPLDVDENCDGMVGEMSPTCDMGIFYADTDPWKAARAIDLCDVATSSGNEHGVIDARWVRANGVPASQVSQYAFGIQQNFGSNVPPRKGVNMLVLSSGHARLPGQQNAAVDHSAQTSGTTDVQPPPAAFPQSVPNCQSGTDIYDDIGLELVLRAPVNATGFKYQFKFYSFEFAEWVCTNFNDQFVALASPPPMGAINGNLSFDLMGNPVSVNVGFFDVCDPSINDFAQNCPMNCPPAPSPYCPSGTGELLGTGFDDGFGTQLEDAGATSWLETTAPVTGGAEFSIRFTIWDVSDTAYDSTVVVDGFEWLTSPGVQLATGHPNP